MSGDIYSLDKGGDNRKIVTSHQGAAVSFGGGSGGSSLRLIQQASVQYQQRTEARFELGSDTLYWATGQSQGTMQLNKLVGAQSSVWAGFKNQLAQGRGKAKVNFTLQTDNGNVKGDGVFSQVGLSLTVGDMSVADSAVMSVANIEPTSGGGGGNAAAAGVA